MGFMRYNNDSRKQAERIKKVNELSKKRFEKMMQEFGVMTEEQRADMYLQEILKEKEERKITEENRRDLIHPIK